MMIVEVAAGIRARAGQWDPAFSTGTIVDRCFPGVMVTGGSLPDGVDEMVTLTDGGPVIVYRRDLPGPMQRFVIAHALAHIVYDDFSDAARPGRLAIPEHEARADAFAAELLAPLHLVAGYVGVMPSANPEDHEIYLDHVDEIASRFSVPAHVIDSRIRQLH